jgi:hypothetical protein
MAEEQNLATTIRGWGLGWFIALIVLILCVVLWFMGTTLSAPQVLGLIAALALARLL